MRFYQIKIYHTDKDNKRGKLVTPKSMEGLTTKYSYTSVDDNDKVLSSALDIYLDVQMYELGTTRTGALIRISGISREDIAQFTYLPKCEIELYAGMLGNYLPLAHSVDPNLLMRGTVWWAAGNWEGVNTSLDLMMTPLIGLDPTLVSSKVTNFTFVWQHGQKASDAIKEVLDKTFGKSATNPQGYEIKLEISEDLVWQGSTFTGVYTNLSHFSEELAKTTVQHFPNTKTSTGVRYGGIQLKVFDKTITVYDRTKTPAGRWTKDNPLELPFTDLIGQPTWKDGARLTFKTPMRGDLQILDWVKLPKYLRAPYVSTSVGKGQPSTDPGDQDLPSRKVSTFEGAFEITAIRHVGQFRQPDAQSWVTVFDAQPVNTKPEEKTPLTPMEEKKIPKPEPPPGGGYPPPNEASGGPIPSSNPTNPLNTPQGPSGIGP